MADNDNFWNRLRDSGWKPTPDVRPPYQQRIGVNERINLRAWAQGEGQDSFTVATPKPVVKPPTPEKP